MLQTRRKKFIQAARFCKACSQTRVFVPSTPAGLSKNLRGHRWWPVRARNSFRVQREVARCLGRSSSLRLQSLGHSAFRHDCVEGNVGSRRAIFVAIRTTFEMNGLIGPKRFGKKQNQEPPTVGCSAIAANHWLTDLPAVGKMTSLQNRGRPGSPGHSIGRSSQCTPMMGTPIEGLGAHRCDPQTPI